MMLLTMMLMMVAVIVVVVVTIFTLIPSKVLIHRLRCWHWHWLVHRCARFPLRSVA
jgi:uncharacterized protein YqgC (DUF456 family)